MGGGEGSASRQFTKRVAIRRVREVTGFQAKKGRMPLKKERRLIPAREKKEIDAGMQGITREGERSK